MTDISRFDAGTFGPARHQIFDRTKRNFIRKSGQGGELEK